MQKHQPGYSFKWKFSYCKQRKCAEKIRCPRWGLTLFIQFFYAEIDVLGPKGKTTIKPAINHEPTFTDTFSFSIV